MSEIRVKLAGEDVERVFHEKAPETKEAPVVEFVTTGIGGLLFIDGRRVNGVIDIQFPRKDGQIAPQVVLTLHAKQIIQRTVSGEEFKRLREA
ncbi:MAG: hypothetical protein JSS23_03185 [Proteobacteria bacterium]|nr:hypothetical protein [Pseudomonadota bacterium]